MLKSEKNVAMESSIPHMVITSTEGEDEEVTLGNVNGVASDEESSPIISEVKETKEKCPTETRSSEDNTAREPTSQIPESSSQSTVQRPLVLSSDSSAAKPVESIYEVIEPKERVPENVNCADLDDAHKKSLSKKHGRYEKTPTSEIPKETDGFFAKSKAFFKEDFKPHFSFPKFSFGGKDQKRTVKDIGSPIQQSISTPNKEDMKMEKNEVQGEYSLEAAEELSYMGHVHEHYRKLDDNAMMNLPCAKSETDASQETSKPISVTARPLTSNKDHVTIQLAPEEPCELLPKPDEKHSLKDSIGKKQEKDSKKQEKDSKKQEKDSKKQEKDSKKATSGKRASTPESLYDTCCIRLAVLIRNKAIEIASDKGLPPKKPPKPSAEALAKARADIASKKLREYESTPHPFGDDISFGGFDGIRYADEDTESSTDYKDLEDLGIVTNPECYGIIRKLKDEGTEEHFRASSICSGMTSYYTADTATLKDENSSDNTLETVSLGSYESVVCKAPNSEGQNEQSSPTTYLKSSEKAKTPIWQPTPTKKVPPPIPPKPLLESYKCLKSSPVLPESTSSDVSRCVNTLCLSPRPVLRNTAGSSAGIKQRPLTIASVKETEFSEFSRNKSFSSLPKRPVLNTVVRNSNLTNIRRLPSEPMSSISLKPLSATKSLPLDHKAANNDFTSVPLKPPPPPRPPPPVISSSPSIPPTPPIVSNELTSTEEIVPPPRRVLLKHHTSPVRPTPPTKKPLVPAKPVLTPPPRPPPPRVFEPPSVQTLDTSNNNYVICIDKSTSNEIPHIPEVSTISPIDISVPENIANEAIHNAPEDQLLSSEIISPSTQLTGEKGEIRTDSRSEFLEESDVHSKHSLVADCLDDKSSSREQSLANDTASINLKTPKVPPRGRRKRSRTVEIVSHSSEVTEIRRRSQSLTDLDVEKRLESLKTPGVEKQDLKSLYTSVNKDHLRAKNILLNIADDHGRRSPSTDSMSSRPLPAPPPPPRSKSHSASRRSKSDERPSSADNLSSSTSSIIKADSMPSAINGECIRPPARKNKESRRLFFSLRAKGKEKKIDASRKFHTIEKTKFESSDGYDTPIKPGRRVKPPPLPPAPPPDVQFDENANVAYPPVEPIATDDPITSCEDVAPPPLPARQRGRSMHCDKSSPSEFDNVGKLSRSLSERPIKKSHSSWYDDEVDGLNQETKDGVNPKKDSCELLDWSTEEVFKLRFEQNSSDKVEAPPRTKKGKHTSKFYVNVDEEKSFRPPSVSPAPTEDKETSPFRLDCSEKSVQTSLETLSLGAASRGEASEDTDDLLDLAQTLQDELKTIITRHKSTVEQTHSSEESAGGSEHSGLAYDSSHSSMKPSTVLKPLPNNSTSSASEAWQMSSSDDSEIECPDGVESNVSLAYLAKKKKKIFYIAQEIMTSEKTFVDSMRLLNVDFREFVNEASKQKGVPVVPDDVLNQILNHLPQLQHLNENLLLELEDRINNWDKTGKIADVIVKMGPFLKLYSWYIQDFEATTSLLEETKKKHALFAQVVKDFELSSRCKRLSLNHFMLKPVQRIPQYRLLLQEYLHHLSEDCDDYEPTKEALRIVSEVANHANESMKQGDNFQKLMSIQSSILGHKEIIKPGRKFIKEGELMKLSRRGMQPRWFVLLNDMLLYLTQVQQGLYRIHHELMLAGMKVAIPIQQDYQNEFSIISVTRSFTLAAKSQEERQEWIVSLTKAIEENASKRSTFTAVRLQQNAQKSADSVDEESFVLGKQAPVWIPDTRVTMCQLCTSEFTVTFRRHHCRACGKVICSICSSNRISLPYLENRIARVCDECYVKLGQGSTGCTESGETDSDNQQLAVKSHLRTDQRYARKPKRNLPSVLKEVCANDQGSTLSGYMHKRSNKNWKRNWFVIKDKVLYEYRASEDVAALRSIPLLGFEIKTFSEPIEGIDSSLLIELSHPGQAPITFHAETPGSTERWIKALREATVLE